MVLFLKNLKKCVMMNMSSYAKHNLYLGDYKVKRAKGGGRFIELPKKCNWEVLLFTGESEYGGCFILPRYRKRKTDRIALILNETKGEDHGFWPVISFLSNQEAKELIKKLNEALSK